MSDLSSPLMRQALPDTETQGVPASPASSWPVYTVGSLFSGIGGLDLGFERAGFAVRWFCEADPFCQRALAKHWPGVPCHNDVRLLGKEVPAESIDVLIGGFP